MSDQEMNEIYKLMDDENRAAEAIASGVKKNPNFKDRQSAMKIVQKFKLSGENIRKKMHKILEELYNEKKILDHGMVVGKELAYVLSGGDTDLSKEISED